MLESRRDSIYYRYCIEKETVFIKYLIAKYEDGIHEILMPAFNPVLLIFKVLHQFKMFPNLPELKKVDFSTIPVWRRIEVALAH